MGAGMGAGAGTEYVLWRRTSPAGAGCCGRRPLMRAKRWRLRSADNVETATTLRLRQRGGALGRDSMGREAMGCMRQLLAT